MAYEFEEQVLAARLLQMREDLWRLKRAETNLKAKSEFASALDVRKQIDLQKAAYLRLKQRSQPSDPKPD